MPFVVSDDTVTLLFDTLYLLRLDTSGWALIASASSASSLGDAAIAVKPTEKQERIRTVARITLRGFLSRFIKALLCYCIQYKWIYMRTDHC